MRRNAAAICGPVHARLITQARCAAGFASVTPKGAVYRARGPDDNMDDER